MSSFNITDVTIAGAYTNAITAAEESARRNAERRSEPSEGPGFLSRLLRRVASALSEKRPAAPCPAARRA